MLFMVALGVTPCGAGPAPRAGRSHPRDRAGTPEGQRGKRTQLCRASCDGAGGGGAAGFYRGRSRTKRREISRRAVASRLHFIDRSLMSREHILSELLRCAPVHAFCDVPCAGRRGAVANVWQCRCEPRVLPGAVGSWGTGERDQRRVPRHVTPPGRPRTKYIQ